MIMLFNLSIVNLQFLGKRIWIFNLNVVFQL